MAPELAYSTSALAQGSVKKVLRLRAVNEFIDQVQALSREGKARSTIRPLDIKSIAVLTMMDASFAKDEGCKSQMGYCLLSRRQGHRREARGDERRGVQFDDDIKSGEVHHGIGECESISGC